MRDATALSTDVADTVWYSSVQVRPKSVDLMTELFEEAFCPTERASPDAVKDMLVNEWLEKLPMGTWANWFAAAGPANSREIATKMSMLHDLEVISGRADDIPRPSMKDLLKISVN